MIRLVVSAAVQSVAAAPRVVSRRRNPNLHLFIRGKALLQYCNTDRNACSPPRVSHAESVPLSVRREREAGVVAPRHQAWAMFRKFTKEENIKTSSAVRSSEQRQIQIPRQVSIGGGLLPEEEHPAQGK